MSSQVIGLIVWALTFGAALIGMSIGARLPAHHRADATRNAVSVSMAMVGTLTALVLGLLLSVANTTFQSEQQQLTLMSTDLMRVDRLLRAYGPEADGARAAVRRFATAKLHDLFPPDGAAPAIDSLETQDLLGEAARKVVEMNPPTPMQRLMQQQVLSTGQALGESRWQLVSLSQSTIPVGLLALLMFWLVLLFGSYGLFAPRHATTIAVLFLSSAAAAGAVLLIIDLQTPFRGFVHLSAEPMRHAVEALNH